MIKKILIANRGEIALRIIRTCKEMGIKTVAVYSVIDKNALHVRFADEAVCIGLSAIADSYLNVPRIIAAAEITNSDAIHPGYGFLAEDAEFAEICKESNIIFIGPDSQIISEMSDKAKAKNNVKQLGIPVVQGSDGVVNDYEDAKRICNDLGYPVIIKASARSGGKGMRAVREESKLEDAISIVKNEAMSGFNNDDIYIEKLIEEPKHIEVQVLGDKTGRIIHLGERDCTIQRRYQKLIEETPTPFINDELRGKMTEAAIKIATSINYIGAGTVEFLVDKNHDFYFMKMNTRLQTEHPITEGVTNTDLIKEQIIVASGGKITIKKPKFIGHAIECRINVEDMDTNSITSPRLITTFHSPGGNGVRVDTHCYAGYTIPHDYDSMIGKLIVIAEDRNEAIKRMTRALEEFIIEGVKTTIPLFQKIMNDKKFINYEYDTNYIEKREKSEV
jgi:acetyl-CoA carboxylase, biotin carboxylase subunit